jgi:serralysin
MTRSLVFIDSRVAGYQSLIAGLNADTGWVLLDSEHDGLAQMQAALVGYSGLESIQILSHGSAGALWLGTTFLDQSHIGDTLQPLHAIGQALAPTGDLLLYGCNVAAGEVGRSFIAALAEATGADVAASTDPTGAPALGGDWVLEQETGSIEASGLQGGDLSGLLAANTAPTFAIGDGMVTTDFGSFEYGNSVTVQADGKILVAGPSTLVRYNAGGSLDTSFDGDGKVTTGGASASVTVQADGKILVAGDSALERYNIDGSLDSSFDGDGKVTTGGASASVTVQADGKILVAGGSPDFSLARYNADGSLDTSFDGDGKVTTDFMGYDSARSVTVQADGKILVAGRGDYGGSYTSDFALARYNADGSLDTSFDIDGKVTTGIYNHSYKGESVTVQADGKILVAGDSSSSSRSPQFALARYNTDGSLDTSFSGDGLVSEISFGSYISSFAKKVTVQADGKILVAGRVTDDYYHTSSFALARFNANGSLDASFDNDGRVTTDFGSTNTYGSSATLQADGKILVAGTSNYDIALARYNADGSLDKTFSLAASTLSSSKTYSEQDNPIILDRDVQIFDTDLAGGDNYNGATLTLSRHGGANADDVFSAASGGSLSALQSGSVFSVNGVVIGLVTGNSAGTLTLAFTANATQSRVNSAIEQIAYANTSDTPPATVQIDWNFNDGNSGAQGTGGALGVIGSTTVHITSVNDVPTLATPLLDQDLAADLPFSYTLPAGAFVDLDLETLTYSASMADGSSMPLWLSFNTATHSFTGTPGAIDVGVAEIRVTATDVASASANDVFRLIVAVPINGASGDDSLSGGAGLDIMNGFAGNDTLNGGGGGDNLTGGTGKDTFRYTAATDSTLAAYDVITDFASDEQIAFSGMAGITAYSGSYTYTTSVADTVGAIQGDGGITNRHVFFTDGSHGYLYIKGAGSGVSFDGTLIKLTGITSAPGAAQLTHPIEGSSGNDTLIGGAGDDLLDSGAGSDYLNGGAGADTMLGGDGTDAYAVDHAGDLVSESNADLATGGNDIVYSTLAAYTLTDHVERLRLMFGGTSNGTGNTLDNMLYAGDGNNVLDGGAGNDTVSYAFATAGVAVSLATAGTQATGGSGSDTLISIENLIGGGFNDSLIGNAGNNVLDGGAGNDTVSYVSATAPGVTVSLATAGPRRPPAAPAATR